VEIAKPGSYEKRKLGIPTVRDRVVQQSIRLCIEPLYEPKFSHSSYGFRPNRGQQEAIAAAQRIQKGGKEWVVDIDLEKFFDRINHDRLIHKLKEKVEAPVLRLIGMILRCGIMHNGQYEPSRQGAPQGSPLSPLLSNIVLDELDKELERRGLEFCRYADDGLIFVGSKAAGERVMDSITRFIEKKLKLKVNQVKSKVAQARKVVFLGFTVTRRSIRISAKSIKRARAKLRELIPRRTHVPMEIQLEKYNQWYKGWLAYYQLTNHPHQLAIIEAHARRRYRAQLVGQSKRRRFLVKKLKKRGIKSRTAVEAVYGQKRRTWKLSNLRAVTRAWSNEWFEKEGMITRSTQELDHWKPMRFRGW
jgi:group II intron reverse transcriptase/maturase